MAIAELLGALGREADAEIAALDAAADAACAKLCADAEARRAAAGARAEHAIRAELQAHADAEVAAAARVATAEVLEARARMLARLRDAVVARLPALIDDTLRAELAEVVRGFGATPVAVATGEIGDTERVHVDATLATALARWWPRLAIEGVS